MRDTIEAWWWIARHPFKSAAIRRFVARHDSDDPECTLWTGDRAGTNLHARCSACADRNKTP